MMKVVADRFIRRTVSFSIRNNIIISVSPSVLNNNKSGWHNNKSWIYYSSEDNSSAAADSISRNEDWDTITNSVILWLKMERKNEREMFP